MTREEALDILHHNWTRIDNPNYKEEELDEAFFMAIEALHREEAEANGYCHRIKPKEYFSADAVKREAHYDAVANRITDMEERGFVSVVRCKDCRHQEHCHETVAHTKDHDGFREHWSEPIEWCSRGERREP